MATCWRLLQVPILNSDQMFVKLAAERRFRISVCSLTGAVWARKVDSKQRSRQLPTAPVKLLKGMCASIHVKLASNECRLNIDEVRQDKPKKRVALWSLFELYFRIASF